MLRRLIEYLTRRMDPDAQAQLWRRLRRWRRPARLGTLRRWAPLSDAWGFDRGTPIDRHYIESFLETHATDIRGSVLEVRDSAYTRRFGRDVERAEVLDIREDNPHATIIADLSSADSVPGGQFDCFIITQTLQMIYEAEAAVRQAQRLLRPGGVLLATVPVISRIIPRYGLDADFWRFTPASCRRLFGDVFGADAVHVSSYGNALTAVAFVAGVACEELRSAELEASHPYFPVVLGVRAVKPMAASPE